MILDKRRKAFHYRHAVMLPAPQEFAHTNFQEILSRVLTEDLRSVRQRVFHMDSGEISNADVDLKSPHIFVNNFEDRFSMLVMEVMYIEPGTSVPVINADYESAVIECNALILPSNNDNGASQEFLDSTAYIGVYENHVIFVQSKAIGIKDIEVYFNHLLQRASALGDSKNTLIFQSRNSSLASTTLRDKTVKNVRLVMPLAEGTDYLETQDGYRILATLIGESRLEQMKRQAGVDISDIKVDISFGYKYQTSPTNQAFLDSVAESLLDARDEEMVIELKNAGRIVGNEIQLKKSDYVTYENSLPQPSSIYNIMANWLIELLEKGLIEP